MTQPARADRVLDNVITPVVLTGLTDIATWTVVGPITVARVGVLVTAAQSGAQPVIRFDLRPTYGSDVGRINGKFGAFQFPAGGVAVGKTVGMASNGRVDAGQQIVCAITTVGGAGSVIPIFEWETRSENPANQGSIELAGVVVSAPQALGVGEQQWESPEEEEIRREREEEAQAALIAQREDARLEQERLLRETPEETAQRRERQAQERRQARAEARQRREQEEQPERVQADPAAEQLPASPVPQPV